MHEILQKLRALEPPSQPGGEWIDYASLGLPWSDEVADILKEAIFVPDVLDELSDEEFLATVTHAWRYLGARSGAETLEFFVPLLRLPSDLFRNYFTEDFANIVAAMGERAVPALLDCVRTREPLDDALMEIISCLGDFASAGVEQEQILSVFASELERCLPTHLANARLVMALVDCDAGEHIDAIRTAYEADVVNRGLAGSLAEVEHELGCGDEPTDDEVDIYEEMQRYAYLEKVGVVSPLPEGASSHEIAGYYLQVYGTEMTCEDGTAMEGVIATSLSIGKMVPLPDLLGVIWSADAAGDLPIWQEKEHETAFFDALLAIQKSASEQMAARNYFPVGNFREGAIEQPKTAEEELNSIDLSYWGLGVLRGFSQFLSEDDQAKSPWRNCIESVAQLVIHEQRGEPTSDATKHPLMQVLADMQDIRAAAQSGGLDALAQVMGQKSEPIRAEEKPNRNEPCPCGSGTKYKKCCGG